MEEETNKIKENNDVMHCKVVEFSVVLAGLMVMGFQKIIRLLRSIDKKMK